LTVTAGRVADREAVGSPAQGGDQGFVRYRLNALASRSNPYRHLDRSFMVMDRSSTACSSAATAAHKA